MKLKKTGFTLVEIMIVVAILALLAGIAIPNLLRSRVTAGESIFIPDGSTLLSAVAKAAIAGKFTEEEAETIASQLDRIMLVFGSMRCAYYVNAWDSVPAEGIVEPVLTTTDEVAKIDVAEKEVPAKKGRKSSK